jgi:putative ABC transport system permease protein
VSIRIASRGLRRRRLRNGLTILAVIFAVGILVGVNVAGDSIMLQVRNTVLSVQGDIDISVRWATGEAFDDGNTSVVASQSGIKTVSPILGDSIFYLNRSLILPVTLVGVVPSLDERFGVSNLSLNILSQTNSCIATEEVAQRYNITEGSTIVVSRVQLFPPNSTMWKLKVVGVAHIEGKGYSGVLIANLSLVQGIFNKQGKANSIVASVSNSKDTLDIRSQLQAKLGSNFQILAPKESSLNQVDSISQGFTIALNMAATISLAVACILIMNSLLMAVNERKYETGVLRSIGSSRGVIFRIFILEGLFFGVIGSALGIIFGVFLSQFLVSYMATIVNVEIPSLIVNTNVLVFGAVAGIVVSAVGSLYPALSASKTSVVQAIRPQMRGAGKGRLGTVLMATIGAIFLSVSYYVELTTFGTTTIQQASFDINVIYILLALIPSGVLLIASAAIRAVTGALSYVFRPILRSRRTITTRNIGRNRRRSSLTISMVAIGISFTVLIGGMSGSLMVGINNFVRQQLGADIYIMPKGGSLPSSYAENLTNVEGIRSVTYLKIQPTLVETQPSALVGVNADTFLKVWHVGVVNSTHTAEEIFARLSRSNTSLIMASGLAGKLRINVGNNVTVLVEGGKSQNFTVVATFYGSEFINLGPIGEAQITMVDYKALIQFFPGQFNGTRDANIFLAKVNDGESPETVGNRITNFTSTELYVLTISSILTQVEAGILRIFAFFQVLITMAIVVSLLGMTTTMVMSVLERKREIGILRAIGTSKSQIMGMIVGEALVLGTIGLLVGLSIGILFSNYFIDIMTFVQFAVPLSIPYAVLIYVALASIIISVASAAYPAYKASSMDVVDAIRYG